MKSYKSLANSYKEVIVVFNGDYWQDHHLEQEVLVRYPFGSVHKEGGMLKDFLKGSNYFSPVLKYNTVCIVDK